jgi:hypothetical protein
VFQLRPNAVQVLSILSAVSVVQHCSGPNLGPNDNEALGPNCRSRRPMAAHKSIAENDIDIRTALLCRYYENKILIFTNYRQLLSKFGQSHGRNWSQNLPKEGHGGHPEPRPGGPITLGKNP